MSDVPGTLRRMGRKALLNREELAAEIRSALKAGRGRQLPGFRTIPAR
jgi:hypothetical protein